MLSASCPCAGELLPGEPLWYAENDLDTALNADRRAEGLPACFLGLAFDPYPLLGLWLAGGLRGCRSGARLSLTNRMG